MKRDLWERTAAQIKRTFPRSRERGHIEATLSVASTNARPRFRAHVSAATLKREAQVAFYLKQLGAFPRSRERGHIEA